MQRSTQAAALAFLVVLSALQVVRHAPALAAHPRAVLAVLVVALLGILAVFVSQRSREG